MVHLRWFYGKCIVEYTIIALILSDMNGMIWTSTRHFLFLMADGIFNLASPLAARRDRPPRPSTIKTEDILSKTNIPAASCQLGFVSKWIKKSYLCSLKSIFGCLLKDGDKSLKPENLEAVQSGEQLFVTRRESFGWDRMDSVGWMYRGGARCGPKNPVIISRGSDQLPIYRGYRGPINSIHNS